MRFIDESHETMHEILKVQEEQEVHFHDQAACAINRDRLIEWFYKLRKVIFPHYFATGNPELVIHSNLPLIYEELFLQLKNANKACLYFKEPNQARPEQLALHFIKKIPSMITALYLDIEAAMEGDPAAKSRCEIILCYPGFYAVLMYRIAHTLYSLGVPLIPRVLSEFAHSRTGCDIHPGATIGSHFFIDHATGVVIGETTEIGNHVTLYQHVTLGALSFSKDQHGKLIKGMKRHPTVEDNVVIYSGTTVLGGKTVVGEGCVIGGNCWITESIPAQTKIILDKPSMRYIAIKK